MNSPMKYQVALVSDVGTTYVSTSLIAADNAEAITKAKHWMRFFNVAANQAWLQVSLNGIGIWSSLPSVPSKPICYPSNRDASALGGVPSDCK